MTTIKPRNPFAHSSLLRKGGAHTRSASTARFAGKQALLAELDDWQADEPPFAQALSDTRLTNTKPGDDPVFLRLYRRCFGRNGAECGY